MNKHLAVRNSFFRRPPRNVRRALIVAALVCVGLASVLTGYIVIGRHNPLIELSRAFIPSPQQVFGKQNLLVLVEGLDYDYTATDQPFSSQSRSDVIWAVNFDFANHRIYELSVPRDMLATFPDGSRRKINEAQSDGGPREAEHVIAGFLGISGFDRYAVLRINAAREVIDAIGGVNVDVKNSDCLMTPHHCVNGPIDYDDTWGHLHIHLKPGMQHLNGGQAVGYARFRHDWCSDPCRIMRQQQVARAVLEKLKGDKLSTLLHLGQLIGIVHANLVTNLTQSEMLSIADYYADITPKDFHSTQVPYTGDVQLADGDDLIPDDAAKARLVQTMLVAPPTPTPAPPSTMALAAIPPSTLRVDVENGSGVQGVAHRIAEHLRKAGFQIGDIGDAANTNLPTSEIQVHSAVLFAGARVREAMPGPWQNVSIVDAGASPSPQTSDVTIIVGRDLARPE
ncbi:MAG: LCP family protein [Candidatus Tyrphobacter sp.]